MTISKDARLAAFLVSALVIILTIALIGFVDNASVIILIASLYVVYIPLSILAYRAIKRKTEDKGEEERQLLISFGLTFIFVAVLVVNAAVWTVSSVPGKSYVNGSNEIVLKPMIGKAIVIPVSETVEYEQADSLLNNAVRTEGMGLGRYRSGYYEDKSTGQKLYLFMSGKGDRKIFGHNGLVYVTDGWDDDSLQQIESYIKVHPDSALNALRKINPSDLSKADKAKHALLLSMAYDENYIDKTDFETIQPALDYYRHNGTATDKLLTYYYEGVIHLNNGNEAAAMESFLTALDKGADSDDVMAKARVYVAQGVIYNSLYEWEKQCEVTLSAAEIFREAERPESYVNCILKIVGCYMRLGDKGNCEKYYEICRGYLDDISTEMLGSYYSSYLTYLISIDDKLKIKDLLPEYLSTIPEKSIEDLTVGSAYIQIGEFDKALEAIQRFNNNNDPNQVKKYYILLTDLYENNSDYKKALDAYKEYNALNDSTIFSILEQDTQFIEERHTLELKALKEKEAKNRTLLWSAFMILALLAVIFFIRLRLKIKKMERALAEQEVENRLKLLNQFIAASITGNRELDKKATKELEKLLADKKGFMSSTRLAFEGSHPEFIKHLESCGLTEWEINYCCLYALGLKGKEIGDYIQFKSHFNNSSEIRKKLGLTEHDINLGTYIRNLLRS